MTVKIRDSFEVQLRHQPKISLIRKTVRIIVNDKLHNIMYYL